ncbi:MAG: hypothetical protein KY469_17895 [Actinobacteria bacterium]|nr:hypothetical protein [Actinomycetota bacterium]
MGAGNRIKSWLRRDEAASSQDTTDAPPEPAPDPPREPDPAPPPAEEPETGAAERSEHLSESLPLAQDQELLGPCRDCDGYWTRLKVRGQKPMTCPACKQAA